MGLSKRNPWLAGLGVLLAGLVGYVGLARADVTSDAPGSIIIFPKVIADGTRDTLIQITNTKNVRTNAHCWYFNALDDCRPNNFSIELSPQQPTFWRVSTGRRFDDGDCTFPTCSAGLFATQVPERIKFQGELKCVEVDDTDTPILGNSLKGEALLETLPCPTCNPVVVGGQVSEYNAIAIQARKSPNPKCVGGPYDSQACTDPAVPDNDNCRSKASGLSGTCLTVLSLDNNTYNACPRDLFMLSYPQGGQGANAGETVTSELTLVPCTEDIENDRPVTPDSPTVNAIFEVVDEEERGHLSGNIPFTCWLNLSLGDTELLGGIFDAAIYPPKSIVKTRISTSTAANKGLLGVLEEFHTLGSGDVGTAAVNLHESDVVRSNGDVIIVPTGH
jgi:hypothetical protein